MAACPPPSALFDALLACDNRAVHRMLKRGDRTEQFSHVGPCGITSLHLAVLSRSHDLLAPLAAAGAPLDAAVGQDIQGKGAAALRELQGKLGPFFGEHLRHSLGLLLPGSTPLALAASMKSVQMVRQLLSLGADPCGGGHGVTPLTGLAPGAADVIAEAILRQGGDCLARCRAEQPGSWLAHLIGTGRVATADCLLRRLEQQRAAGSLCLGDSQRAAQLLLCAAERRHWELCGYALRCLQQQAAASGGQLPAEDVAVLGSALHAATRSGDVQLLQRLLSSGLPLALSATDHYGRSLLSVAATVAPAGTAARLVRMLCQAGAAVAAVDLLRAVDQLSAEGVEALLACGVPAVGARRPSLRVVAECWSCPVHRTLRTLADKVFFHPIHIRYERSALRILEALAAADVRPAVYRCVVPPRFLQLDDSSEREALDPFSDDPKYTRLKRCMLHAAKGPTYWSPAHHRAWPEGFGTAAATVLLAAHRGRTGLASLPPDVVLHILRLAAHPMSAWV